MGETDGFMSFFRKLPQSEMQTTFSRIWNWVADLISYDNNHNVKGAEFSMYVTIIQQRKKKKEKKPHCYKIFFKHNTFKMISENTAICSLITV